jgi:hypothetical protein
MIDTGTSGTLGLVGLGMTLSFFTWQPVKCFTEKVGEFIALLLQKTDIIFLDVLGECGMQLPKFCIYCLWCPLSHVNSSEVSKPFTEDVKIGELHPNGAAMVLELVSNSNCCE